MTHGRTLWESEKDRGDEIAEGKEVRESNGWDEERKKYGMM